MDVTALCSVPNWKFPASDQSQGVGNVGNDQAKSRRGDPWRHRKSLDEQWQPTATEATEKVGIVQKVLLYVANGVQPGAQTYRMLTGGTNLLNGVQKAVNSNLTVPTILFLLETDDASGTWVPSPSLGTTLSLGKAT